MRILNTPVILAAIVLLSMRAPVRAEAPQDPADLCKLADRYAVGDLVPQDLAKAAAMYRQAAQVGYTPAMVKLGQLYRAGNGIPPDQKHDSPLLQQLDRKIPEMDLRNIPFTDAINFLKTAGGIDILVQSKEMAVAGIEDTKSVNIQLKGVTLAQALRAVLHQVGGSQEKKLDYVLENNSISISTSAHLAPRGAILQSQQGLVWINKAAVANDADAIYILGKLYAGEDVFPAEKESNSAVREMLARRLPQVNFDNIGFFEALQFLRERTGLNIVVNWDEITMAGVSGKTQVKLNLKDVRSEKVLRLLLQQTSTDNVELDYRIEDGIITISSMDDLVRTGVIRDKDMALPLLHMAADRGNADAMRRLGMIFDGSATDAAAIAQLDRPVLVMSVDHTPVTDAISFLRDVSGANIFVNWHALQSVQIDATTPVSADLKNTPFAKVLQTVLDSAGGDKKIGYALDDGVITLSTPDDLARYCLPQDYSQALAWYRKAADAGDARAMTQIAVHYQLGHGVDKDRGQSLSWLHKAADHGDEDAKKALSAMDAP